MLKVKSNIQQNNAAGFSLIEVAIGLMIIGLLMTPLIQGYKQYLLGKQVSDTKAVITTVQSAMVKYVAKYGRYPLPSDPDIAVGAAGLGQEATEPGSGWPPCASPTTKVCRTNSGTFGGNRVLIGTVPFAALGIPYTSQIDGFGMKLTYAITEDLTDTGTYDEAGGAIEVLDENGKSLYFIDVAPADTVDDNTTPRSHFALISHGATKRGAYSPGGTVAVACGAMAQGKDNENCDRDGVFISNFSTTYGKNIINDGAGATFFDDFVASGNTAASGIWTFVPNSPNIESTNSGNIYVGPCASSPCIPFSKMDVNGNVRADIIKSKRICDKGGSGQHLCVDNYTSTYFPAWMGANALVGAPSAGSLSETVPPSGNAFNTTRQSHDGAGIRCVGDRGLNGTASYNEYCNSSTYFTTSTAIGSCAAGYFPKGLDSAGKLVCALP